MPIERLFKRKDIYTSYICLSYITFLLHGHCAADADVGVYTRNCLCKFLLKISMARNEKRTHTRHIRTWHQASLTRKGMTNIKKWEKRRAEPRLLDLSIILVKINFCRLCGVMKRNHPYKYISRCASVGWYRQGKKRKKKRSAAAHSPNKYFRVGLMVFFSSFSVFNRCHVTVVAFSHVQNVCNFFSRSVFAICKHVHEEPSHNLNYVRVRKLMRIKSEQSVWGLPMNLAFNAYVCVCVFYVEKLLTNHKFWWAESIW